MQITSEHLTEESIQELRRRFDAYGEDGVWLLLLPIECEIVIALCDFWAHQRADRKAAQE
jgi:hypothetical protein